MKCPRCQHENRVAAKFCDDCGTPLATSSYVDVQRSLTEALARESAIGEILRVIGSSPTDVQPVFDAIASSALRLCDGIAGFVFRYDGMLIHLAAVDSAEGVDLAPLRHIFPAPPDQLTFVGRAVAAGRLLYIADIENDHDAPPSLVEFARANAFRSIIAAPMLRHGHTIGGIGVTHRNVDGFTSKQGALLQTFADQAVIAIENVRLFTELEARNRDLATALEKQTATAEILRVIARSPTDLQPVFDELVLNARRLLRGYTASLLRLIGDELHLAAASSTTEEGNEALRSFYPIQLRQVPLLQQAIRDREPLTLADIETDPRVTDGTRAISRVRGYRSMLSVPLTRSGQVIGVIGITRQQSGQFASEEIDLLRTFADQAVIAIENVRLFTELQEKNRALTVAHAQVTETLERQTATSEILRVISSSPTALQPVFDTIAERAVRLCDAAFGAVFRFNDGWINIAALTGLRPDERDAALRYFPRRPKPGGPGLSHVLLTGEVAHIQDVQSDPAWQASASGPAFSGVEGFRTCLIVPLVREGVCLGAINVWRREPAPFSEQHIELLKTFADQAVIAIENVRLFNETKEALEQQTATSEILRVISSSPTDVQPVFDTIVRSATRLCRAVAAAVFVTDGRTLYEPANYGGPPEALAAARARYPRPLDRETASGTAILTRSVVHVPDVEEQSAAEFASFARRVGRAIGFRSLLAVPMLREGEAVGAINVTRSDPGLFSDTEVALLRTFADQAVIAIENVRLFTELQDKNKALTEAHAQVTEALDQQTATSEILRVISRSQTELQPVFDAIVDSAARLCHADIAGLFRVEGGQLNEVSSRSRLDLNFQERMRRVFPRPLDDSTHMGRALLERRLIHVADLADPSAPPSAARLEAVGFRAHLAVPMLRGGEPIGGLSMLRRTAGLFSDDQVQLLQTFADQAVIAIENARLLNELQARTEELTRSVEQLTALGEVGRAVTSTLDLETVLTTIVSRAVELSRLDGGVVFEYDEGADEFVHRVATDVGGTLAEARRATRVRRGEGVVGQTALTLEPAQVPDITVAGAYESRLRDNLIESGVRAILAVPMVREGELIGCLVVSRNRPGEFATETIDLLRTFATQSALAIQNARLFREIEQKSLELEAASRHKSEFLANMSHELRTPLNAVIGFSEVLSERMFGDLNEKQDEYLKDIHASGQHLLSLINDILDLSKIEAGKMDLELSDCDLPMTIDNALMLVRERAARRSITLNTAVDERVGHVQADERKIRQVLLNLLSNAIKFTPEGGRIHVEAKSVNESIEVSVTDTGIGIATEDQDAVFEEFKQVGTADKKVEGTGLGLALSRKFIELHGGKIWVKSQVGEGSTFTFTVPARRAE